MPADLAVVFPRAGVSGGVERVTLDFLAFEQARRPVTFVGHTLELDGVRHAQVRRPRVPRSLAPIAFRRGAARALRDLTVDTVVTMGVNTPPGDVLWVHSVHAAWLASGGDAVVLGRNVPSVLRRALLRHQVLLRLEHDYFTRSSPRLIICTSQREIDDLAHFYDVPRSLMHVVPNGYDATLFSVARRTELREQARARIGATGDDVSVLVVANEWHRKGLAVLLEAVALTRDRRIRIDLVGARSPDPYRPLAQRLGLAEKLHWHGPSNDVAQFHAAADVFALPTTYEPFGLVIVEAMASGLPVITSRLAGASEAIMSGDNGILLADPRDAGELAAALARLGDSDERDRMGARAPAAAMSYERNQVMERADRLLFPA